eukprot:TRINITY_DN101513_c0_g1_i1.p1 TRINITY_DN101513_c0_g1~~TRINITY_DN101513_c0_g1_i1.p1  ORF type:complete len:216 (-),score=39.02 TRINITY_DN101513_c0_g1_i1:86-733(-)
MGTACGCEDRLPKQDVRMLPEGTDLTLLETMPGEEFNVGVLRPPQGLVPRKMSSKETKAPHSPASGRTKPPDRPESFALSEFAAEDNDNEESQQLQYNDMSRDTVSSTAYSEDQSWLQTPPDIIFEFRVQKAARDDWLGMDVRHVQGHLHVLLIHPSGAVGRANAIAKLPLVAGDVIQKVNGAGRSDAQMVADCKSVDADLRFTVARWHRKKQSL